MAFKDRPGDDEGYDLYSVKGWDYPSLCETYLFAAEIVRREHVPAIVHVTELTQPQGHSTSGSHERYKSAARLDWEREYDCLLKMREWMLELGIAGEVELERIEEEDRRSCYRAPAPGLGVRPPAAGGGAPTGVVVDRRGGRGLVPR